MSAKRARKPLSTCSPNVNPRPAKRAKATDSANIYDPATFHPMQFTEHEMQSCLPPNTSLTPTAIFNLFWDDMIIEQVVEASNAYAQQKKATKRQWRRPLSTLKLRKFVGITILMGVTRLGRVSCYWSNCILSARSSMSYDRYCQIK